MGLTLEYLTRRCRATFQFIVRRVFLHVELGVTRRTRHIVNIYPTNYPIPELGRRLGSSCQGKQTDQLDLLKMNKNNVNKWKRTAKYGSSTFTCQLHQKSSLTSNRPYKSQMISVPVETKVYWLANYLGCSVRSEAWQQDYFCSGQFPWLG